MCPPSPAMWCRASAPNPKLYCWIWPTLHSGVNTVLRLTPIFSNRLQCSMRRSVMAVITPKIGVFSETREKHSGILTASRELVAKAMATSNHIKTTKKHFFTKYSVFPNFPHLSHHHLHYQVPTSLF